MLRLEVTLSQAWLVSSSPPDGPEEITAAALTGEGLTAGPRTRERGPAGGGEFGGGGAGRERQRRVNMGLHEGALKKKRKEGSFKDAER